MADEVLSQAEVESLLTRDGVAARAKPAAHAARRRRAGARRRAAARKGHALRLQAARARRQGADAGPADRCTRASAAISGRPSRPCCGSIVEVKLTSVDQLTYSEFVFSLENPTCFNLLRAEPLEGNLILDINPSILYPIIDRLLGGGKDAGPLAAPAADGDRAAAGRRGSPTLFLRRAEARLGKRAAARSCRSSASRAIRSSCRSCRRTKSSC